MRGDRVVLLQKNLKKHINESDEMFRCPQDSKKVTGGQKKSDQASFISNKFEIFFIS